MGPGCVWAPQCLQKLLGPQCRRALAWASVGGPAELWGTEYRLAQLFPPLGQAGAVPGPLSPQLLQEAPQPLPARQLSSWTLF